MKEAAIMHNEALRLKELHSFKILDTEDERDFDQLVELATLICQSEISLVTLVDKDRQWFKARKGLPIHETPRQVSFCAHTILQDDVFVVHDAASDERFWDNPLVADAPFIRFYAGAPIVSEQGYNLGTVCVIDKRPRNLTRLQEEALIKLARQAAIILEGKRKNALLKRTLEEQQDLREKAENASKAQQYFLSTMSHEIRTPLNGVIGMTDLLLASNPLPQQLEYLQTLKFASDTLLSIVNDILDYNKIISGNLSLEQLTFDLRHLLDKIRRTHQLQAEEKGISLEMSINSDVPQWVTGDSHRLTQVLNNLVSNAIKFTHEGGVKVLANATCQAENQTCILFEVIDSGMGIQKEKQELIFNQFEQASPGISRQFGGTGLGLAISKKLLELQGSTIKVDSFPGKGSRFYFELCFETRQAVKAPTQESGLTHHANLSDLQILLVEDNIVNQMVVKKFLSQWGIKVDCAENGVKALEKVMGNKYDLILMDLQMPEMDGITATSIIRNEQVYRGPIVALTADAFFNTETDIHQLGFDEYILKPFNQADLFQKISRLTLK